jgi:hypothetical protein
VSGKYTLLQRDYFSEVEKAEPAAKGAAAAAPKPPPKSKLPKRVQDLVTLLCDTQMMNKAMAELQYDANKLPCMSGSME